MANAMLCPGGGAASSTAKAPETDAVQPQSSENGVDRPVAVAAAVSFAAQPDCDVPGIPSQESDGQNKRSSFSENPPPLLTSPDGEGDLGDDLASGALDAELSINDLKGKVFDEISKTLAAGTLEQKLEAAMVQFPMKDDSSNALEAKIASMETELQALRKENKELREENVVLRESAASGSAVKAVRAAAGSEGSAA